VGQVLYAQLSVTDLNAIALMVLFPTQPPIWVVPGSQLCVQPLVIVAVGLCVWQRLANPFVHQIMTA